jgi:hypothetical protein
MSWLNACASAEAKHRQCVTRLVLVYQKTKNLQINLQYSLLKVPDSDLTLATFQELSGWLKALASAKGVKVSDKNRWKIGAGSSNKTLTGKC